MRRNKDQRGEEKRMMQGGRGRPETYNQWLEDRMKGALEEYKEEVEKGIPVSVGFLTRAWHVP